MNRLFTEWRKTDIKSLVLYIFRVFKEGEQ